MKICFFASVVMAVFLSTTSNAGIFDKILHSNDDNLKRATAMALRTDLTTDDVTIIEVHRGMMSVRWKAKTPSGIWSCDDDDMLRGPAYCTPDRPKINN